MEEFDIVLLYLGEDFPGYVEERDRGGPCFHKPEFTLYILSTYSIALTIAKDASQTFGVGLSIPTVPVTEYIIEGT